MMFFPFVLFAVCLLRFIQNQQTLSEEIVFPEDLHDWCPYTTFCQSKTSNQSPSAIQTNQDKFKPCCEPCSCAEDCGLKRQCCRSEYDHHRIDQKLGTKCKTLSTKERKTRDDEFYYIVDECPNKTQTCSSINASIWGSYSPVYSRSTGMIYYNRQCALCHDQTDIIEFVTVIPVHFLSGAYSKILSNGLSGLDKDSYLQFMIPKNIDVSGERCYPYMIRRCMNSEATHYHFKDLCPLYNATFHMGVLTYQNVYCYLCGRYSLEPKQEWIKQHSMCPVTKPMKSLQGLPLTVMLDSNWVKEYQATMTGPVEKKFACFNIEDTDLKTCRPVHCPEGLFRVRGTCTVFGKRWYVRKARMVINLTLTNQNDRLMVSDLLLTPSNELASPKQDWVRRPALHDWNMDLLYNENENDTTVRFMVAVLSIGTETLQPQQLLEQIEIALHKKWTININGTEIELRAQFNRHINYYGSRENEGEDGQQKLVPDMDSQEDFETDRLTKLTKVDVSLLQPGNVLCITKLFFCELIDLRANEFITTESNRGSVYLVNQKKRLGNGEFTVSTPGKTLTYPYEIRVCVSDVVDGSASLNAANGMMVSMVGCYVLLHKYIV